MRGILFDLDDTLYPRELYVQSGFEAVASHVADSWRRSRESVLATLRRAHSNGAQRREFQVLCTEHRLPLSIVPTLVQTFRLHQPTITLHPAVRLLLQQLRRDGWRIGILTNGNGVVQRRKVEALGLTALADAVTYADDEAGHPKPHPDAFLTAVRRLQVAPACCVHVGDDPHCDITGAQGAGLRAIRVLFPPEWSASTGDDDRLDEHWHPSNADATVDTVIDVGSIAPLVLQEVPRVF